MVKEAIRVYARVKPLGRRQQAGIYSIDDDEKSLSTLEVIVPHDLADGVVNNKRESYKFNFPNKRHNPAYYTLHLHGLDSI